MKATLKIFAISLAAIIIFASCKKDDNEVKTYTLTLAVSPSNSGTVSGDGVYKAGEEVNLTATPNSDYVFVNWKNGSTVVSTDANFTYTATAENVTLTAYFALKTYNLTINITSPAASGSVTGSGSYLPGAVATLIATPNTGWAFENWKKGLDILSTEANYSYTTTAEDVTLTANFIPIYTLTITVDPVGAGSVTGAGIYPEGKSVTLTATPNSGYGFVCWKNGSTVISTDANYTYTTTASNVSLTATFEVVYILTPAIYPANSGITTGGGYYASGKNVTITATPSIGYTFVNWTKGGTVISTDPSFLYTTASTNETLVANFTEKSFIFTLGAQANTTIGGLYSIATETVYTLDQAFANQDKIDLLCFYEHDATHVNDITLSSSGAKITGIFGGGTNDPANWTTLRTTLFTLPATTITTTQFDALHQNDPSIQGYYDITVTSGNKKAKQLLVDNIYAFKTADNVYGLFKVTNVVQGADGSVQVELKLKK